MLVEWHFSSYSSLRFSTQILDDNPPFLRGVFKIQVSFLRFQISMRISDIKTMFSRWKSIAKKKVRPQTGGGPKPNIEPWQETLNELRLGERDTNKVISS